MRKYEPIWIQLKEKLESSDKLIGKIAIAAPRPLHRRIIKAIKKEKYNDSGYAFLLSEKGQHAKLGFKQEASKITVILHKSIGVEDI